MIKKDFVTFDNQKKRFRVRIRKNGVTLFDKRTVKTEEEAIKIRDEAIIL